MSDDESAKYGLVMPFVVVDSVGGPYEDAAFVAGWDCAVMDEALAALAAQRRNGLTAATVQRYVKPEAVPQLDLVAMQHGFTLTAEDAEHGWVAAVFAFQPATPGATEGER